MSHIQPMKTLPRGAPASPQGRSARRPGFGRLDEAHDGTTAPCVLGLRRRGVPFRDVEDCIIWTIKALGAVAEGAPGPKPGTKREPGRVCEPIEVVKCLDTLYRRRRIDLRHARILRIWGHRGRAPDATSPNERADWRLWREATERLEWPLRSLGIIS